MREMLVVADAAVVIMLCLAYMRLVPAELAAASSGTSWVDLLASVSVFTVQFGLRQPAGAAVGLVIVAAHTVGRGGFGEAGVVLILQVLLAATISLTLRRAGRAADVVLAEAAQQRSLERAREATRADEREQQRRMHDTVLATLTMVSTGVIGGESDALRRRASDDLMVLEAVRVQPVGGLEPGEKIRLDVLLRDGVIRKFPRLRVALDLAPVTVPAEIAETLTACVDEALRNVGRHAGTTNVRLSTESMRDGAVVTVSDDGAGFEPAKVSPGRRGLRESILGRIRAAGGAADVVTAPGAGTTIVMRWPDG
ncbi:Histidine kinase-like ATPase domain-containing protein [Cryptosporangium aurantiacum]|uniref:Histidine kinase-like ATPase domain-containing protein n=2 Tax=Cryptosporangium aurantiacum TaxID=134849 RepID=A0A1M7RNI2_9ACTN|nr:Histidine kinase-like ATPase domain-containing protein [Cryptosporangium aurantiacum]